MEQIYNFYNNVFEPTGEIKACGREKCKKLINACMEYYKKHYHETVDFGNIDTGFMNVYNIQKFVKTQGAKL